MLDARTLEPVATLGPRGLGAAVSDDGQLAALSGENADAEPVASVYSLPDSVLGTIAVPGYPVAVAFSR